MARNPTPNHGFSKASDSLETFDFTEDHVNLLDRLDAALGYLASRDAGTGNYVDASHAGAVLSGVPIVHPTADQDAVLVFEENDPTTGITPRYRIGFRNTDGSFWISPEGQFGSAGIELDAQGRLGVAFNELLLQRSKYLNIWPIWIKKESGALKAASAIKVHFGTQTSVATAEAPSATVTPSGTFEAIGTFDTTNWDHPVDNAPVSAFDASQGRFVLKTNASSYAHAVIGISTVLYQNVGTALMAEFVSYRNGTATKHYPGFALRDAATNAYYDVGSIADGKEIVVATVFVHSIS